ncbi:TatD family hydrolase [Legionella sp. W05-934-2]|uniref:TatD family hydrolase n=1 Tax=Legionella sp. W05-934-2 TaxID=1198649 RepID=UPI003461A663
MFVDSHCHLNMLDLTSFNNDLDQVIAQALDNQVNHLLCVSVEKSDFSTLAEIADRYPQVSFSTGVHPHSAHTINYTSDDLLNQAISHPKCIALGETGLDYFRLPEGIVTQAIQCQIESFQKHIDVSRKSNKPLIIHTRDAGDDTIAQLKEGGAEKVGGVIHCFTESWSFAKKALDIGFYISFSGIVTFKNAKDLQDIAKKIPLDRLLIETDSPYLAPTPFRGKQNHPALVKYVGLFMAELRGESIELLASQTTQNFFDCFKIENVPNLPDNNKR